MIKIGLTGGICTGKTHILGIFKEMGCYTVKADDIAKNIIFSNRPEITEKIVEVFGEAVCDKREGIDSVDGSRGMNVITDLSGLNSFKGIKKEEFARMMFEDPEKRNFINGFIHPLVTAERKTLVNDLEKSGLYDFFIYESALLVESGIFKDFDKIVVVYTSEEEQIQRLMNRDGLSSEEALHRIKAQFPLKEKLKVAHYTIDTTGSFENATAKALETFHLIKKDFDFV